MSVEESVSERSAAGTTGHDDEAPSDLLEGFDLHDDRWNRWLYVVLPTAAVVQWVLVIPLALQSDVLTSGSPGFDPLRSNLPAGVEPTGFLNDYFFIVWNVFPIVLWGAYMIGDRFGKRWIRDIADHVDTTGAAGSIERLRGIRDHWLPTAFILASGVVGMVVQLPKQLGFFETNSQLYWWDWRINPVIFVIRDVALFFNVILVVLVFWGTLFGLLIIIQALRGGEITPDYFHPDGAGGLLSLGNAMSVFVLPWVAGAFLGVLGFFDHTTASELLFRIGDVLLILVCTGIAAVLFAYPLYITRSQILADLESIQRNVHRLIDQHDLAQRIVQEDPERLGQRDPSEHKLTETASVILVYQRLDDMNGWPVNSQRVYQIVILIASPGITVLTQLVNNFLRTYWF